MSNNIPKKLEIKSEMLRHLDTANKRLADSVSSSAILVASIELEIALMDANLADGDAAVQFWRGVMK